MNNVATILGIQLPSTKARASVMAQSSALSLSSSYGFIPHRDSLLMMTMKQHKKLEGDDDDGDTVSTMLSSSESSLSMTFGVTFAEPLVTEVHLRPYTTRQEKRVLFYQEQDYAEFKREAFYGRRDTLVQFAEDMVSDVWTIPPLENPSEVYYTESELQRFLDEFVASLDKGMD